jgi:AsmA protein
LSILRGSVQADEIVISDDPAFSKGSFVSAKGLQISVQLIPLISQKKLLVDAFELVGPQVSLIQGQDMRWNFSTLGGSSKPSAVPRSSSESGTGLDLSVKRLKLTDGKVILRLAGGKPQGIAIDNLRMEVHDISVASVMPVTVSGVIQPGGKFKLDGRVGPLDQRDSTLTPLEAHLTLENLDLAQSGVVPPSAAIKGVASNSADLRSKAGVTTMNGQLRLDKLQVGTNAKPAERPVELAYRLQHSLTSHSGILKESELRSGKAVARFGGTYELKPQETALALSLNGQAIQVNEIVALLPAFGVVLPQGAALKEGTLSINAKSRGTTSRLTTNGMLELNNSHLTGYSLSSAVTGAASLAGLKVGSETLIKTFQTSFENTPEMTRLDGIQLQVQDLGNMTGAMTLDSKDNLNGKLMAEIKSSGGLTGAGLQKMGGSGEMTLTIPITVAGTASHPQITADTKAVAKQAAAEAASSAVQKYVPGSTGDLIQGLLGKKKK